MTVTASQFNTAVSFMTGTEPRGTFSLKGESFEVVCLNRAHAFEAAGAIVVQMGGDPEAGELNVSVKLTNGNLIADEHGEPWSVVVEFVR
jgi:hypothetical protein